MTWVVPLALGGLAILLMAVFTMMSARKRHHEMVQPAMTVGPRILVHDINDDRCTGCDACVAVCPTNVLDLVSNKSRVLRFQDCIQCEACMFACPTEALVMFPEGSLPPPLKIPEIDEHFQTAVPGQYLIGEVAGKPLVKNAANLGRAVVEHMCASGLRAGILGRNETTVDVVIVGSGPGGLSAALTCVQRGLSYVILEKEQEIASTIARYPKGKLVMAEPYDTLNLSFLPVFDSSKEQLIPIWRELIERVGLKIRKGESVESVSRAGDGAFETRTTVGAYRSQRVVLSIGTRGKPRTLQVPGENLPKVFSLLEDPDEWRGRAVLVVGGGDSAVEAALALSDAGAKVMISYRGKGFNRAAPKNKQTIENYAREGRIKAKLGSQVLQFDNDTVTLALGDGSQKRYPNEGAFVLIGADPPVAWLEKMGIRFVERPHQHQMGKSDDIVRRLNPRAMGCAEDAARAAAAILGGSTGIQPTNPAPVYPQAAVSLPMPMGGGEQQVSGPRKWLRSATSIFSSKSHTNPAINMNSGASNTMPRAQTPGLPPPTPGGGRGKKLPAPVPLSEFAMRNKSSVSTGAGEHTGIHRGDGRRDQLSAGERTRILRMLRDEGGRLADEDSQVFIGTAPGPSQNYDFDFEDDSPVNPPPPMVRPDVPAKPAVVVGLAQAQAGKAARSKRSTAAPPVPPSNPPRPPIPNSNPPSRPPLPGTNAPRPAGNTRPPPRRPVPQPFSDEPTRQVDSEVISALRGEGPARQKAPTYLPTKAVPPSRNDEPTRMANVDAHLFDDGGFNDDNPDHATTLDPHFDKFLKAAPKTELQGNIPSTGFEENESTRLANTEGLAAMERARAGKPALPQDESTRAVNIRDRPMSDVDWDLD